MSEGPLHLPGFGAPDDPHVWAPLLYARRVFVEVLIDMFSNADIVPMFPGRWLYEENENGDPTEDSKITITEVFSQDLLQKEGRPFIIVRADSLVPENRDFQEGNTGGDLQNGERDYLFHMHTDLAIQVWARLEVECALLSSVVHQLMLRFRPIIVECSELTTMSEPTLQAPVPMQEDSEVYHFVAPIQFRVSIDAAWSLGPTELKQFDKFNVRVVGTLGSLTGDC